MKLKVCGMKHNTAAVAALKPDYLGFIFWEGTERNTTEPIVSGLPQSIKRIGVFVNADPDFILEKITDYKLDGVQLHGTEGAAECLSLKTFLYSRLSVHIRIIKAFSVGESFDFEVLRAYLPHCDYFLFDTKGKLPGGNGKTFDWKLLKQYPFQKPFFLSGGISPEDTEKLSAFIKSPEAHYCHGLDVNSKFEIKAGLKDIEKLKTFKQASFWKRTNDTLNTKHS